MTPECWVLSFSGRMPEELERLQRLLNSQITICVPFTLPIPYVWATYFRVSDEDKQTPKRSSAMQWQPIEEQLLVPSKIPLGREYIDLLNQSG